MSGASTAPWSPFATGAALGALEWFTFATAGKGLGVTTPFETTAVLAQQTLAPRRSHVERFVRARRESPAIDWEFALVAGIPIGSWLASRGRPAASAVPVPWADRFGPRAAPRYAAAFAGGALMMMGARTARGCTSGHAITGTMQLAASSWLFSTVMAGTAILAARLLFGRR